MSNYKEERGVAILIKCMHSIFQVWLVNGTCREKCIYYDCPYKRNGKIIIPQTPTIR